MRKVLKSTPKTKEYLDSLPKIYIVGRWARYGVREYPFTGVYEQIDGVSFPLVYDYYDGNGTCDEWRLRTIDNVTTGDVILWTQNEHAARRVAELFNKEMDL